MIVFILRTECMIGNRPITEIVRVTDNEVLMMEWLKKNTTDLVFERIKPYPVRGHLTMNGRLPCHFYIDVMPVSID